MAKKKKTNKQKLLDRGVKESKKLSSTQRKVLLVVLGVIFIALAVHSYMAAQNYEIILGIPEEWSYKRVVNVDPCNTDGKRQKNVVVDIGYGHREYYALTNNNGQLTEVYAGQLEEQHPEEELDNKRYCPSQANVPGVKKDVYDRGHVIADALGGVSNAYNITPQDSKLNRSGEQAQMERELLNALNSGKSVTNLAVEIEYPNSNTQIPTEYIFDYDINSQHYHRDFANAS